MPSLSQCGHSLGIRVRTFSGTVMCGLHCYVSVPAYFGSSRTMRFFLRPDPRSAVTLEMFRVTAWVAAYFDHLAWWMRRNRHEGVQPPESEATSAESTPVGAEAPEGSASGGSFPSVRWTEEAVDVGGPTVQVGATPTRTTPVLVEMVKALLRVEEGARMTFRRETGETPASGPSGPPKMERHSAEMRSRTLLLQGHSLRPIDLKERECSFEETPLPPTSGLLVYCLPSCSNNWELFFPRVEVVMSKPTAGIRQRVVLSKL